MALQIRLLIIYLTIFLISVSYSNSEATILSSDSTYHRQVLQDLSEKKQVLTGNLFFTVFDKKLTASERDALTFLYAYMPLSDIVDYSGEYYLENVRYSLKAKTELPWGARIPDIIFRHFVLPVRVNNENLDSSRKVFYNELRTRVSTLSMYEAILEVNHWAHEKVIYTPSDARTSSPLASVRTAYGRCGEESTFLVAALRSVGIPARQVYTPRWAHTDDNHAWVEAWADGKWYFLGACEPEPILNLAWFNVPASRGMLMHTKVFGRYNGPEEVMSVAKNYTEINVIENYANTAKITVKVIDINNQPIEGANIEFKIYNYAEFYTVATKQTDKTGKTSLKAGKGDMLIWASKNNQFGYEKVSFGKTNEITVALNKKNNARTERYDMVPPPEAASLTKASDEQIQANKCRLAKEDSIRNAYTATFMTDALAKQFVLQNDYDETIASLLVASRGNHRTITDFLLRVPKSKKNHAVRLLKLVSEKDLRDIPLDVLEDNLSTVDILPDNFSDMVLNPRVEYEMLVPYKTFFNSQITKQQANTYRANPQLLVDWCVKEIKIDNLYFTPRVTMSPIGVWQARTTDIASRDIFFVSLAKSLGIPAWKDQVTGKIKYISFTASNPDGSEHEVSFTENKSLISSSKGVLKLQYQPLSWLSNPKYYSHFTLSKFNKGKFNLLNYDEEKVNWENTFKDGEVLDTGYYMLTVGTRLANGSVLTDINFFTVKLNDTTTVSLNVRQEDAKMQVIGNFNSEARFTTLENTEQSILQACGRGYFVVAILGVGQEPTNHALRDIAKLKQEFETWGRPIVMLFTDEQQAKRFNPAEFPELPTTVKYGIDKSQAIQNEILDNMKLTASKGLPIFIIADSFNRIVFVAQGYSIGLGEQIHKVIHGL